MNDFLTFTSSLFNQISGFLMTEPIKWFVGVALVLAVIGIFRKVISL